MVQDYLKSSEQMSNLPKLKFPRFSGKKAIIYCATLPDGRKYIGETSRTLEQRKKEHIYDTLHTESTSLFHIAMRDCTDVDEVQWQVIYECPVEVSSKAEFRHIEDYNTLPPDGLNVLNTWNQLSPHCLYPLDEWKIALEKEIEWQREFSASELEWDYVHGYRGGVWECRKYDKWVYIGEDAGLVLNTDEERIKVEFENEPTGIEFLRLAIAEAEKFIAEPQSE